MTAKELKSRVAKINRFEKVILRLRHIPYSDDPESVYQKHEREREQLREEIINFGDK